MNSKRWRARSTTSTTTSPSVGDRRHGGDRRRSTPRSTCSTAGWCGSPRSTPPGAVVVVHEWLKKAILLLFRLRAIETIEVGSVRVRRPAPAEARPRRGRCAGGAGGLGPLGLLPRAGRRAHAELREHRRLRGRADDGRHLGHGRLVRPDRRPGAPLGRRRHRRACSSRPTRSRSWSRTTRSIGSRCMITEGARVGQGVGARRGHDPQPVDPGDRRRDRGGAEPGGRARLVRGRLGPAVGASTRAASSSSRACS